MATAATTLPNHQRLMTSSSDVTTPEVEDKVDLDELLRQCTDYIMTSSLCHDVSLPPPAAACSRIITNGSLTSPGHTRRVTSLPPCISDCDDDAVAMTSSTVMAACWLELPPSSSLYSSFEFPLQQQVDVQPEVTSQAPSEPEKWACSEVADDVITQLTTRIADVTQLQRQAVHDLQAELTLVDESCEDDVTQLMSSQCELNDVESRLLELETSITRERQRAQVQLAESRQRLQTLMQRLTEPECDVDEQTSSLHHYYHQQQQHQQHLVDQQRNVVEDVEFQLLEMETRHDTEMEPVTYQLTQRKCQLQQEISHLRERLGHCKQQKLELITQTKSDVTDLDCEKYLLLDAVSQERNKQPTVKSSSSSTECDGWRQTAVQVDDELVASGDAWRMLMNIESTVTGLTDDVIGDCHEPTHVTESGQSTDISIRDVINKADESDSRYSSECLHQSVTSVTTHLMTSSSSSSVTSPVTATNTQSIAVVERRRRCLPGTPSVVLLRSNSHNYNNTASHHRDTSQSRPLTRYLPVRDSSFNLRQFIESCGHCLDDQASSVQLTATSCQGALCKMARRRRPHVWQKRWFLMDRVHRLLSWQSSRPQSASVATSTPGRHCIAFTDIVDVFVDHRRSVRSPAPQLTFCIKTAITADSIYVVAPNASTMRIWVDAIVTGAEGYQQFW